MCEDTEDEKSKTCIVSKKLTDKSTGSKKKRTKFVREFSSDQGFEGTKVSEETKSIRRTKKIHSTKYLKNEKKYKSVLVFFNNNC